MATRTSYKIACLASPSFLPPYGTLATTHQHVLKTTNGRPLSDDLLLQELHALVMLDQKALEAADAEIALQVATNLSQNIKEALDASADKEYNVSRGTTNGRLDQLSELRHQEAEFQEKLLQREVLEAKLSEQPQWAVYGAALVGPSNKCPTMKCHTS